MQTCPNFAVSTVRTNILAPRERQGICRYNDDQVRVQYIYVTVTWRVNFPRKIITLAQGDFYMNVQDKQVLVFQKVWFFSGNLYMDCVEWM